MEEWILKRLDEIKSRFEEIEVLMTKKEIVSNQSEMKKISKEYRKLKTINELWDQYNKILKETNDTKELLKSDDDEISIMAKEELDDLNSSLEKVYS